MGITGIVKGLGITLKHFVETYLVDITYKGKRYGTVEGLDDRKQSES